MRIHRNLHAAKRGGPQWTETLRGRVVRYRDSVLLLEVTTRIQKAGAAACLKTGVRRVCAFLDGTEGRALTTLAPGPGWERLSYDPRKDGSFLAAGRPWTRAEAVELHADGSGWVLGARA